MAKPASLKSVTVAPWGQEYSFKQGNKTIRFLDMNSNGLVDPNVDKIKLSRGNRPDTEVSSEQFGQYKAIIEPRIRDFNQKSIRLRVEIAQEKLRRGYKSVPKTSMGRCIKKSDRIITSPPLQGRAVTNLSEKKAERIEAVDYDDNGKVDHVGFRSDGVLINITVGITLIPVGAKFYLAGSKVKSKPQKNVGCVQIPETGGSVDQYLSLFDIFLLNR